MDAQVTDLPAPRASVDAKLATYPTWQDIWRIRWMLFLAIGGLALQGWYHATAGLEYELSFWRNPAIEFFVRIPTAFGAFGFLAQLMWRSQFPGFSAREHPVLSAAVIIATAYIIGQIVG